MVRDAQHEVRLVGPQKLVEATADVARTELVLCFLVSHPRGSYFLVEGEFVDVGAREPLDRVPPEPEAALLVGV